MKYWNFSPHSGCTRNEVSDKLMHRKLQLRRGSLGYDIVEVVMLKLHVGPGSEFMIGRDIVR